MLAKIFPRFVIKGVILNSNFARSMAIELLKSPFEKLEEQFLLENPQHFYQTQFYGYLASLQAPTQFQNSQEANQYFKACQKLKEFNQVSDLMKHLSQFYWEVRVLYNQVQKNNTTANFLSIKPETDIVFEKDVIAAIQKFQKLEDELEAYPEWKEKVVEEIGGQLHMIHNNLAQSQAKRNIFLKLNRQEYFI